MVKASAGREGSQDGAVIRTVDDVVWRPGRGPVTEQEALLVFRDLERRKAQRAGKPLSDDDLPTEVPAGDETKFVMTQRVTTRQRVYLEAVARVQGTTAAALLDVAISQLMLSTPMSPAEFEALRRATDKKVRGRVRVSDERRDRQRRKEIADLQAKIAALQQMLPGDDNDARHP